MLPHSDFISYCVFFFYHNITFNEVKKQIIRHFNFFFTTENTVINKENLKETSVVLRVLCGFIELFLYKYHL